MGKVKQWWLKLTPSEREEVSKLINFDVARSFVVCPVCGAPLNGRAGLCKVCFARLQYLVSKSGVNYDGSRTVDRQF